jgi:PKD repeat protein
VCSSDLGSWNWDFGNGETSALSNPKVFYKEQKAYEITLTITTASGCVYFIRKSHTWSYN